MAKKPKLIVCKHCGAEIAAGAKTCPQCGGKNKKPLYKKWWFWLIIVLLIGSIASGGGDDTSSGDVPADENISTSEPVSTSTPEESQPEPEPEEDTPEVELTTDFERAVWEVVHSNGGQITSVESIPVEGTEESTVIAAILCENNEDVVNSILDGISAAITSNDTTEGIILTFGDIEDGEDADLLVMAGVYDDGTIDISSTSADYNSARNKWIRSQFSAWDGAHTELEKLIVKNLNDEKSYDHISTTYRDISTEEVRDEINKILSDAGYSNRVEVGDLFIQTEFSAKNAFGGTIKNTAFGIASYNNNTITLIDIG